MNPFYTKFNVIHILYYVLFVLSIHAEIQASSIEISGEYPTCQILNYDTVLVTGNCNFGDTLFINPGTKVLFDDDFILTVHTLIANGTENDSIYFLPNSSSNFDRIGSVICNDDYDMWCGVMNPIDSCINDEISYCRFLNLDSIKIGGPLKSDFSHSSLLRFAISTYAILHLTIPFVLYCLSGILLLNRINFFLNQEYPIILKEYLLLGSKIVILKKTIQLFVYILHL